MATQTTTTLQRRALTTSQPSSTAPPAPTPTMSQTARPYKDFLTPALHRRFTNAAFLTLAICWAEATLISSSQSWLWCWMPIGLTGLRTLLLFTHALAVFVMRVMNMHVGKRISTSGIETMVQVVNGDGSRGGLVKRAATVGWYLFSAWIFGEVYLWSRSKEAGLGWVDIGMSYERPRVNENPVLLRCVFVLLAVAQAVLHLLRDYDRIPIEEIQQSDAQGGDGTPAGPLQKLVAQLGDIAGRVARLALPGVVFSVPIYFLFLRNPIWNNLAYPIAKAMVRGIPPNNGPTALNHATRLAWQAFTSSSLLVLLWELSNAIFTIYVSQLPLKKGQPLTSEIKDARGVVVSKSRDPNGSLIRGLKAKNDVPRTFAFWELYLITTSFEARRKSIFTEVDRKDGSTWSEICGFCLAELNGITTRIQNAQAPVEYQKNTAEAKAQQKQQEYLIAQQQQQHYGLPKIAQQGVYDDRQVLQARPGRKNVVGDLARSFGSSPDRKNPMVNYSRQALEYGLEHTGGKDAWSRDGIQSAYHSRAVQVLKSPVGEPFRQTFARRVEAVVLGVPYGGKVNIVHASRSLSGLAVASLREDDFGQAAKDIPTIVRMYTGVLVAVKKFVDGCPPHWSDVYFNNTDRDIERSRGLKDVKEVAAVLKEDLEAVLLAFGEYAGALGLTKKEMREAKEAVGKRPEMMMGQA